MYESAQWETIPFHCVWVSLTLLYGFRVWRGRATLAVSLIVTVGTGLALTKVALEPGGPGIDELAEVPMMASMFLAMVWHAQRREVALARVRQLADKDRAFARDASHLLRTPIAVARGHAELIQKAPAGEQVGEDASVVLDELSKLSRIAHRLLILAAADHEDFLFTQPIDLEELIVDTARRWGPAVPRRWHVDAMTDGIVPGDREQLGYALDALIENAVRFTREGDGLSILAWDEADHAVIEVVDTGEGIEPARIRAIFERFHRSSGGPRQSGTGLGLPIVRAIAEAHGGSVTVTSTVGCGTSFRIRLPGFVPCPRAPVEVAAAHPLLTGGLAAPR